MIRVRNKETGWVYDAIEFNEESEQRIVQEILGWRGVKGVEREGNIFHFSVINDMGEKSTMVAAYSDVAVFDTMGRIIFLLPEARFQESWEALTFDEIIEELKEFALESFTPEGVELIMTTPQPAFDNQTGIEYARQQGWENLRSWLAAIYEGVFV